MPLIEAIFLFSLARQTTPAPNKNASLSKSPVQHVFLQNPAPNQNLKYRTEISIVKPGELMPTVIRGTWTISYLGTSTRSNGTQARGYRELLEGSIGRPGAQKLDPFQQSSRVATELSGCPILEPGGTIDEYRVSRISTVWLTTEPRTEGQAWTQLIPEDTALKIPGLVAEGHWMKTELINGQLCAKLRILQTDTSKTMNLKSETYVHIRLTDNIAVAIDSTVKGIPYGVETVTTHTKATLIPFGI